MLAWFGPAHFSSILTVYTVKQTGLTHAGPQKCASVNVVSVRHLPSCLGQGSKRRPRKGQRPLSTFKMLQPNLTPRHLPHLTMAQCLRNGFFCGTCSHSRLQGGSSSGNNYRLTHYHNRGPQVPHRLLQPRRLKIAANGSGRLNYNLHKSKFSKKSFSKTYF